MPEISHHRAVAMTSKIAAALRLETGLAGRTAPTGDALGVSPLPRVLRLA